MPFHLALAEMDFPCRIWFETISAVINRPHDSGKLSSSSSSFIVVVVVVI